jgi:hypothetical protein
MSGKFTVWFDGKDVRLVPKPEDKAAMQRALEALTREVTYIFIVSDCVSYFLVK